MDIGWYILIGYIVLGYVSYRWLIYEFSKDGLRSSDISLSIFLGITWFVSIPLIFIWEFFYTRPGKFVGKYIKKFFVWIGGVKNV